MHKNVMYKNVFIMIFVGFIVCMILSNNIFKKHKNTPTSRNNNLITNTTNEDAATIEADNIENRLSDIDNELDDINRKLGASAAADHLKSNSVQNNLLNDNASKHVDNSNAFDAAQLRHKAQLESERNALNQRYDVLNSQ